MLRLSLQITFQVKSVKRRRASRRQFLRLMYLKAIFITDETLWGLLEDV
ncbi:hypothetical protein L798_15308 [Zootermopsis nevadensis]|uniref:Uncharacterized protein n=1 Tax=Zootermopsis nevadensis TaxID=136037 RepID=A0A067QLA9_ZOONE|nr:hypothetical protein L798_15308 [Zootermopsis nevadensis]